MTIVAFLEWGIPVMEHLASGLDWNSVQIIIAVADAGSITAAARRSGVSVNGMRRSIERLESQLGIRLFHRNIGGAKLTDEGRRIIASARSVEKAMDALRRTAEQTKNEPTTIRVAVTEGLGTFWLVPRLVEFIERSGNLDQVEIQAAIGNIDVLRLEADISVQLVKPENPDLIARKLGCLHLAPFASPEYLAEYGMPKSLADLSSHRIVEQATDQLSGLSVWLAKMFSPQIANRMIRLRTNVSSANFWAVAKSAGLGLLPSYAPFIGARLQFVDIGFTFPVTIWMAIHPEVTKSKRHRAIIDLLVAAFDSRRYPWFGDEFVRPADIDLESLPEMDGYFRGFVASQSKMAR